MQGEKGMLNIAVVGATGLVGQTACQVAQERGLKAHWQFFASDKDLSRQITMGQQEYPVQSISWEALSRCDVALMLTPSGISQPWIEKLRAQSDALIIDNASTYRLSLDVPLIIPEINGRSYQGEQLIANPNCVTIQLLLALSPLKHLMLQSAIVTSFQSVSGSGWPGLADLNNTQKGMLSECYPHPIWGNVLPQCDSFDGDWTKEEEKVMAESQKILAPSYPIYPTCTRVPVPFAHQICLTLNFDQACSKETLSELWQQSPRVVFLPQGYALNTQLMGTDTVFISRLRSCDPQKRVWQCWIGADNLRVGAATNALNILEMAQAYHHSVELGSELT